MLHKDNEFYVHISAVLQGGRACADSALAWLLNKPTRAAIEMRVYPLNTYLGAAIGMLDALILREFPPQNNYIHIKYESGEEEVVDTSRINPERFTPPFAGAIVCCHCRGGGR